MLASGGCLRAEQGGQSRKDQIREVDIALKPLCVRLSDDDPEDRAARAARVTPVDAIHRRIIDGLQQYAELPDHAGTPEEDARADAVIGPLLDACYSLGERIVRTNADYGVPEPTVGQ